MESNFSNSFSRVAAFFFLLSVIFLTGCGGGGESKAVASSTSNTRSLGVIPLPQDQYLLIPKAPTPSFGTLPDFFDLTDKFPSPLNQGSQGSCVGWAVAYYKSYQEAIDHKWDVKTHFFSPSFVYNQLNRGVDNGTHIVDALDLLERSGLPLLADMPYDEKDYLTQPSPAIKRSALVHRSKNYGRVEYSDLRTQLAAGNPIVFSIAVFADLDQLNTGTYNDVYDVFGEGDSRGFHAMTIVGYDDQKQVYKVINSWGKSWGVDGYGYISYEVMKNAKEFYVMSDLAEAATLDSISVVQYPFKLTYQTGDIYSDNGLIVNAVYSDGSSRQVSDWFTSIPNMDQIGTQKITVTYSEINIVKNTYFDINVFKKDEQKCIDETVKNMI